MPAVRRHHGRWPDSMRRGGRRAVTLAAASFLVVPSLVVAGVAEPAGAAPKHETVCPDSKPSRAAAVAAAAKCKGRVEIGDARTERGQVFANRDGSYTTVTSARVQRVKRANGSWVAPDSTLKRQSAGGYAPAASSVDMSFSAGGQQPLVTLRREGASLSLRWPKALPEPVVSGRTLTYRDVLPKVDLVVTADVEGFGQALVVKDSTAAANPDLAAVRWSAQGEGLQLREGQAGSLSVVTDSGQTVFGSGTPTMWDSSTDQPATGDGQQAPGTSPGGKNTPDASGDKPGTSQKAPAPKAPSDKSRRGAPATTHPDDAGVTKSSATAAGDGAKVASMPLTVSSTEIAVVPDRNLLTGPSTKFPVYIDPALFRSNWTMINSQYTTTSYMGYGRTDCGSPHTGVECAKVGYINEHSPMAYRSLFEFATGDLAGKHIMDATLSMDLLHSYYPSDSVTYVHVVNSGLFSGLNWSNNAGAWGGVVAQVSNSTQNRTRKRTEWGVTGAVQSAVAGGAGSLTLGLRAAIENTNRGWKKFDAGTAYLTVTYNSYPNAPDSLAINDNLPCVSGDSRPYLRTLTPKLAARLSDPDGNVLNSTFWWWPVGGSPSDSDTVSQGSVASGTNAYATIPSGRLTDGGVYAVRARASDGVDTGQYSQTCEFKVDVTPPATPASVTSSTYPSDGQLHGGAGVADTFSFRQPPSSPDDLAGFAYTLDDSVQPAAATQVSRRNINNYPYLPAATVTLTPYTDGPKTLRVWARDYAGNYSTTALTYRFGVRAGAGPDAMWRFDEGSGSKAADATNHGNALTASGTSWGTGRGRSGSALGLGGTSAAAATSGPLATKDPNTDATTTVRTDANLTVSAWVRLDATGSSDDQVAVSQDGSRTSAYTLGYSRSAGRWRFAVAGADQDSPTLAVATSNAAPTVGAWTHLIGTLDITTKRVTLYVDGVAQTVTGTASGTFNATGAVAVGRARAAGSARSYLTGAVDDVRVYGRLVGESETEFTRPLEPVRPTVSFPTGTTVRVGQPLQVTLNAGGDPTATSVRYSLGGQDLSSSVALPSPGGTVTVSITPTKSGTQWVFAAAANAAGRLSESSAGTMTVKDAPTLAGSVMDASGAPVSGATVMLAPGGGTVTTGSNGMFSYTGLSEQSYLVSASVLGQPCGKFAATQVAVDGTTNTDLVLGPQSDRFGYTCATGSGSFVAANDAVLTALTGDDAAVELTLPFPIPFYGKSRTRAWASTNGLISFDGPSLSCGCVDGMPNGEPPNSIVAAFWDDFVVDSSASVRTAVTGSSPNRRLIVEWRDVAFHFNEDQRATFEAVFSENGDITLNYGSLDGARALGETAQVGLESPGGMNGLVYTFHQPILRSGVSVTFRYPAAPRPLATATISGTVTRSGTPVSGATVWLDPQQLHVTTDSSGRYSFGGLELGGYTVEVDRIGCIGAGSPVELQEDQTVDLALAQLADGFGYQCEEAGGTAFLPAATPLSITDDNPWDSVTLPFAMTFYGTSYTQVYVAEYGYMEFAGGGESDCGCGDASPSIRPYNTRLAMDGSSSVLTSVVGTAPNRRVVVEWRNAPFVSDQSKRVTFEAILGEDGTITFNYGGIDNDTERTVPWVGLSADRGELFYDADTSPLANGRAIVFHPPAS